MSVPYKIVKKSIGSVFRKIAENKDFQNGLFASTTPLMGYLYHESVKEPPPFPDPVKALDPKQAKQNKEKSLSAPTVKTPIDDLTKKMAENTEISNRNFEALLSSISQNTADIDADNNLALDQVKDSPFMANQVLTKDTLDYIAQNMEAQTILLGYLNNTLEKNLSALVGVKIIEAQNAKVNLDKQSVIADNVDNGTFFYAFIPTFDYWAKADLAQYEYDRINNVTTQLFTLPSRLYASGEVSLIDSLEGVEINSVIRAKVEEYRKSRLSSGIRALIGQTSIDASRDQAETNSKAKEYYTTATESLKENAVPEALNSLVSAVVPVAEWAEKAKARETYLQTPQTITDLDGEVVVTVAPMVLSAQNDAVHAREKTDIINETFDDTDNPLGMIDLMPLLNFAGRSDTFDKSKPLSNFFMPEGL